MFSDATGTIQFVELTTTSVVLGSDWTATVTPQAFRLRGIGLDVALFIVTDGGEPPSSVVVVRFVHRAARPCRPGGHVSSWLDELPAR